MIKIEASELWLVVNAAAILLLSDLGPHLIEFAG
jgi:hypothetical protein